MNHKFYKGQNVDYYQIWTVCEWGYGESLAYWMSGFKVVEPISPYNPACVLIVRTGWLDGIPFNAQPAHVRPAYVKQIPSRIV